MFRSRTTSSVPSSNPPSDTSSPSMRNVVSRDSTFRFFFMLLLHLLWPLFMLFFLYVFCLYFHKALNSLNSRNFNSINYLQIDEGVCGTGMGTITPGLKTRMRLEPQVCFSFCLLVISCLGMLGGTFVRWLCSYLNANSSMPSIIKCHRVS